LHHEGHEEHEVKRFENINFRILRVLHALRGEKFFGYTTMLGATEKIFAHGIAKKKTLPNVAFGASTRLLS
jgi:hypothetical protein